MMKGHPRIVRKLLAEVSEYLSINLDDVDVVNIRLRQQSTHDAPKAKAGDQHPTRAVPEDRGVTSKLPDAVLHDCLVGIRPV